MPHGAYKKGRMKKVQFYLGVAYGYIKGYINAKRAK